jgi:hypothetical protein
MPIPTCDCVSGNMPQGDLLANIYCALYSIYEGGGGGGTGNVTAAGTLASGEIVIGQGGSAVATTGYSLPATAGTVGYLEVPSNSQSAAYPIVLSDSGKSIDHPATDANARTYTIPANGSIPFPVGTCISFSNMTSQVVTIAITTDTMYLAGTGSTGNRALAQYGVATARKITSTAWLISGTGLT